MKILDYYKCYGANETIKKVFRYCFYLKRFTGDQSYYKFSKYEKKNVALKKKKVFIIANSSCLDKLLCLINTFNMNGYNVVFCAYDNVYLKQKFLNISGQIKYKDFVNYKDSLVVSYKLNVKDVNYIIKNEKINTVEDCDCLFDKIIGPVFLENNDLISIIVLNYNNKDIIFKCINSIVMHSKRYNYELIVVDNNSTDGSYEELLTNKNIRLFKNSKNGCSSGRNIGINNSQGKYLLFLDSDQYPLNNYWLDDYINILESNKDSVIGWAAGWLNNKLYSGKTVDFYEYRYMPPAGLYRTDIGYLGTGGMFGLKSDFEKTDLFDENYDPTCYEDTDISFQLKNKNIQLIYSPYLGIIHDEHQTTHSGSTEHFELINKKGCYFKNKWSKINLKLLKNGVK